MAEFNILGFLTERIGVLIREYNTVLMNDRDDAALLDELSRLSVLRDELKKRGAHKETGEKPPGDAASGVQHD